MLERLLEAVRGEPTARVVVVHLSTGKHECYDLRPGSFLLLEGKGEGALDRLTGRAALRRSLEKSVEAIDEQVRRLDVAVQSNRELTDTVHRQAAVLAAVFEARTLAEAKARALWAQNPVM